MDMVDLYRCSLSRRGPVFSFCRIHLNFARKDNRVLAADCLKFFCSSGLGRSFFNSFSVSQHKLKGSKSDVFGIARFSSPERFPRTNSIDSRRLANSCAKLMISLSASRYAAIRHFTASMTAAEAVHRPATEALMLSGSMVLSVISTSYRGKHATARLNISILNVWKSSVYLFMIDLDARRSFEASLFCLAKLWLSISFRRHNLSDDHDSNILARRPSVSLLSHLKPGE